jgi:hypothetical protein
MRVILVHSLGNDYGADVEGIFGLPTMKMRQAKWQPARLRKTDSRDVCLFISNAIFTSTLSSLRPHQAAATSVCSFYEFQATVVRLTSDRLEVFLDHSAALLGLPGSVEPRSIFFGSVSTSTAECPTFVSAF